MGIVIPAKTDTNFLNLTTYKLFRDLTNTSLFRLSKNNKIVYNVQKINGKEK